MLQRGMDGSPGLAQAGCVSAIACYGPVTDTRNAR